jgi:hypothetical protein
VRALLRHLVEEQKDQRLLVAVRQVRNAEISAHLSDVVCLLGAAAVE